ncbi:MAG: SMP-30/gluconolactonase/LRE family protein, partial [Planctomycetota bacterium]
MFILAQGITSAFSPLAPLLLIAATRTSPIPADAELRLLGEGMTFIEGPVWIGSEDRLVFSDIPESLLMQWNEADGVSEWVPSEGANGNFLDREGRLISCQQGARNVVRRSTSTGEVIEVVTQNLGGLRFNSPNDVVEHGAGCLWFTDPSWGLPNQTEDREVPGNFVYRHDPKGGVTEARLQGFCMPNGIGLSPDERTLYVTDTGGHPSHPDPKLQELPPSVNAFALDESGDLEGTEPLWSVEIPSDGICVDSFGRIYLTTPPGVVVLASNGEKLHELKVPRWTTNVCIGGPSGHTLLVTAE